MWDYAEMLAAQATSGRWTPDQQAFLEHLAATFPAAKPPPVGVRVWESESYVGLDGPHGRGLNVAFAHPSEPLWHVDLFMDDDGNFQAWLLDDDTHLDFMSYSPGEPEHFVDDVMSGNLTFTVTHYAGRIARITANRSDISSSFLVPPSNVGFRRRILTRRRTRTLRWTDDDPTPSRDGSGWWVESTGRRRVSVRRGSSEPPDS